MRSSRLPNRERHLLKASNGTRFKASTLVELQRPPALFEARFGPQYLVKKVRLPSLQRRERTYFA
jgi:hypothetical protein